MTLATDIDEQILAALQVIFALEMQVKVGGDALALQTLKQDPLQDDPTVVAPFVVYSPALSEEETIRLVTHKEMEIYGGVEIGGPLVYMHLFEASFGTPQAATREQARRDGATLMSRIVQTLITYSDLSGVLARGQLLRSADQSKVIELALNRLVTKAGFVIYGGEQTFYTKGKVSWQYPVSWYVQTRAFTGF